MFRRKKDARSMQINENMMRACNALDEVSLVVWQFNYMLKKRGFDKQEAMALSKVYLNNLIAAPKDPTGESL